MMFNNPKVDLKIKQAFIKYNEQYTDSLPSKEKLKEFHAFSPEYERKKQRIIKYHTKAYFPFVKTVGRQVAAVLVICFLALGSTAMSVKAIREPIINFIVEIYEKFSRITFQPESIEEIKPPSTIEQEYIPSFIPAGYSESSRDDVDVMIQTEYTNKDGDILLFSQMTIENRKVGIDTEETETKEITVNDNSGIFYSNKGWNTVLWNDKRYAYSVFGMISEAEILKVAESVEMKK